MLFKNPRDGDVAFTNSTDVSPWLDWDFPIALRAMIVKPLSNVRLWRADQDQKALTVVALGKSLKARATLGSAHMMDSTVAIKNKFGLGPSFLLKSVKYWELRTPSTPPPDASQW